MTGRAVLIAGAGLGAGLMYLLDAQRGRRRPGQAFAATARDMSNRARGVMARARAAFGRERDTPDGTVSERVRSKLGHHVSHPGSIEVAVANGRVILAGPVLASELDDLMHAVRRVRGVRDVESRLQVQQGAEQVPGLKGGVARGGERWSSRARALAGAAGAGLLVSAGTRRGLVGAVLGLLGLGMLARAATDGDLRGLIPRLKGLVGGGRPSDEAAEEYVY
jgi:hypothetical protein